MALFHHEKVFRKEDVVLSSFAETVAKSLWFKRNETSRITSHRRLFSYDRVVFYSLDFLYIRETTCTSDGFIFSLMTLPPAPSYSRKDNNLGGMKKKKKKHLIKFELFFGKFVLQKMTLQNKMEHFMNTTE